MNMKYDINDVPANLRDRMGALVDRLETRERQRLYWLRNVAASLLVVIAAGGTWMAIEGVQTKDTTEMTPEQAAKETERALKIFAQAVHRGQEGARKAEAVSAEATHKGAQKALETLKQYTK